MHIPVQMMIMDEQSLYLKWSEAKSTYDEIEGYEVYVKRNGIWEKITDEKIKTNEFICPPDILTTEEQKFMVKAYDKTGNFSTIVMNWVPNN
ncbi:MAG: hypothetical protein N2043_01945 [Ignavibacterium sp.]|nr:hypothetical protein [Ignavibacterium sp.]